MQIEYVLASVVGILRLADSVTFDGIVPALTEDNVVSWGGNRGAINFLLCHRVKLREFDFLSLFPIGKAPKLASGETSEALS